MIVRWAALFLTAAAGAPALAADFELPPSSPPAQIRFSSDEFDYERSSSIIHLKGNVVVRESTWTIRADEVWMNMASEDLRAKGHLEMDDGTSIIAGREADYCFGTSTGTVYGAAAAYPPWRIKAGRARVQADRGMKMRRAWFTSCEEEEPHFHLRSSWAKIQPRSYLLTLNTVFFLGPVPVFYTPVFYKSLNPKPMLRTRMSPGHDRRNGSFLKTTTLIDPLPGVYGEVFADYYDLQGPGAGTQWTYAKSEQERAGLFAYRIEERNMDERVIQQKRWAILGDLYHVLGGGFSAQARVQTQSDPGFNNHYARSNAYRVTPELINNGAVAHSSKYGTARVSYSRVDTASPATPSVGTEQRYLKTTESAPRVDFNSAPVYVPGVPLVNTFNGFYDNVFSAGSGFLQKSAGAGWIGSQSFRVMRGLNLTSSLGFNETYVNRRDRFSYTRFGRDSMTGRYLVANNLRATTIAGVWDLSHSYQRRLVPNQLKADALADDFGVEANAVTLRDVIRPNRKTFLRVESAYSWRDFRSRTQRFEDRLSPITADFTYVPIKDLSLSVINDFQVGTGNRAFIFQGDWGERGERFIGVGVSHHLSTVQHYFLHNEIAFPWGNNRFGGTIRSDLHTFRTWHFRNTSQVFEREIWWTRRWHDFFTRAVFRTRPLGVKEGQVNLELRWDAKRKEPREDQAPWRPWAQEQASPR